MSLPRLFRWNSCGGPAWVRRWIPLTDHLKHETQKPTAVRGFSDCAKFPTSGLAFLEILLLHTIMSRSLKQICFPFVCALLDVYPVVHLSRGAAHFWQKLEVPCPFLPNQPSVISPGDGFFYRSLWIRVKNASLCWRRARR